MILVVPHYGNFTAGGATLQPIPALPGQVTGVLQDVTRVPGAPDVRAEVLAAVDKRMPGEPKVRALVCLERSQSHPRRPKELPETPKFTLIILRTTYNSKN